MSTMLSTDPAVEPASGAHPIYGECPWCESWPVKGTGPNNGATSKLPEVFCWTKIQAEAGQSLDLILHRKEMERVAGAGLFFWGVGTSLARKFFELLKLVSQPNVLFSVMKSKPKPRDISPEMIYLWTSYVDLLGQRRSLPDPALVLSRASTEVGLKTRHYALACYSEGRLGLQSCGKMQLGHFRNLGSTNPRIGSSQVTAVIEHLTQERGEGPLYGIDLVTGLADPFFVQLADPVLLPMAEKESLDSVIPEIADAVDWMYLVGGLKRRLGI
jgi:hypothetical protein